MGKEVQVLDKVTGSRVEAGRKKKDCAEFRVKDTENSAKGTEFRAKDSKIRKS